MSRGPNSANPAIVPDDDRSTANWYRAPNLPAANTLFYRAGSSRSIFFLLGVASTGEQFITAGCGGGEQFVNGRKWRRLSSLCCAMKYRGLANHGVHTTLPAGEAVFEGRSRKVRKLVFEDIERSPDVASISSRCGRRLLGYLDGLCESAGFGQAAGGAVPSHPRRRRPRWSDHDHRASGGAQGHEPCVDDSPPRSTGKRPHRSL